MTPLRVIIVDDEPLARRRLEQHLSRMQDFECAGTASGCAEGKALTDQVRPDIVLLDIKMRDGTGFDFVELMGTSPRPSIIFVTAFDRHAVEAFEASATDFLVKPVEFRRLEAALTRARSQLRQRERAELADELEELAVNLRSQLTEDSSARRYETELWVRHRVSGFVRVDVKDLLWVEAQDDYVKLVTGHASYFMRGTLKDLQARLDPQQFARIHRSTLVRFSTIRRLACEEGNMVAELAGGTRLKVGRVQAKRLRAALARFERNHIPVAAQTLHHS